MYNQDIEIEILKAQPYRKEKKGERMQGVIIQGQVEVKDRAFFNDIDFAGKEMGVSRIISGEIPLRKRLASLRFFKRKNIALQCFGKSAIPVEILDISIMPEIKEIIYVILKLDVKTAEKKIIAEFISSLKEFATINLQETQEEIFPLNIKKS